MAQQVGYFEDYVTYEEGPFVIVNACGWRIEAEIKNHPKGCPALPDLSIYKLRDSLGYPKYKFDRSEDASKLADHLNQLVREGQIVLKGDLWVAPEFQ